MIKIKKIKPLFNRIVTTADKYEEVMNGTLIDATKSDTIKEYQKVLAVGTTVTSIKVGDMVLIDPTRYMVRKHKAGTLKDNIVTDNPVTGYNFNVIEMDGKQGLLLFDSDIIYIAEEYEEVKEDRPKPKSNLILPDKKIIV